MYEFKEKFYQCKKNDPFVCSAGGDSPSQASVILENRKFCPKAMKHFMVVQQIHEMGDSSEKTVHNAPRTSIK